MRGLLKLLATAAIAFAAGAGAAQALTLKLSPEVSLEMAVPAGLCALDPAGHPVERQVLSQTEALHRGVNNVLAFLAECPAVEAAKQGKPADMNRWVIILAQLHNGQLLRLPGFSRAEYITEIGKLMPGADKIAEEASKETTAKLAELLNDNSASVGLERMLGPLARDANGMYVGMIGLNRVGGKETRVAGLGAFTFLRGHAMTVNVYRPYRSVADFEVLVNEAKVMTADLAKRND